MKRIRIVDVVVSTVTLVMVALALAPAVARLQRTSAEAKCQSNMRRWAQAIMLILPGL